MLGEAASIDPSSTRASFSDQPVPPGSAPRALRQAAESAGLDPVAELYNEALKFTAEGQLKESRSRLTALLLLAPEDGEARLLLAKVQCAGQKWGEALAALDEAEACGQDVPITLRSAIEEHLRADRASDEEQRAARTVREQGEVKALRQEARRLRSDNAQLTGRTNELERETRKWAMATAIVSGLFILFLLGNLLFGGGGDNAATEVADITPIIEDVPVDIVADDAVVAPETIADRTFAVLQGTEGLSQITVGATDGNTIILSGTVPTARNLREARELTGRSEGVEAVDVEQVSVLARPVGTTYTVKSGDNLGAIALAHYGDALLAERILAANRNTLRSERSLQIGQELVIPAVE